MELNEQRTELIHRNLRFMYQQKFMENWGFLRKYYEIRIFGSDLWAKKL